MTVGNISAQVGPGKANRPDDVRAIQTLLRARGYMGVPEPNGVLDAGTAAAIREFQGGFLRKPDGVVDPGGMTWRALSAAPASSAPPTLNTKVSKPVALPANLNPGITPVGNALMMQLLGAPVLSGRYSQQCQDPTNPRIARNIVLDTVGPFRVRGLLPAVLSLKAVMADIKAEQPAVYKALGTQGMLCCRNVRGSTTSISNHSWGTAIDLTLEGILDAYGDGRVQVGLTQIAPIFNRHGWYWGAAFRKEDGMHFEGGKAAIEKWVTQLR
jgi:peptidoglycan hydrolase-like protein with peptidoglycan-binding domain